MWRVDNSVEVLDKLSICNQKSVRNVRTFDFSTLYTSIPHEKLKKTEVTERLNTNQGKWDDFL